MFEEIIKNYIDYYNAIETTCKKILTQQIIINFLNIVLN